MARYIDADALIKKMFPLGMGDGMYVINAKAVRFAIDNAPTADVVPKSEVDRLEKEIKALQAFRDYFSDLYGHGLEVANWHENGALEPFDNFHESAEEEYERSLT